MVYREIRERLAALNAYLSEALSGMAVIQLFTREREAAREFDELNLKSRDAQMIANVYDAGVFSSVEALSSVTIGVILWVGGGEVIHRVMTLGTLVAFIDYAQIFFMPLRDVSSKYTTLQSALAAIERIEALMETPASIASPRRAAPPEPRARRDRLRSRQLRLPRGRAGAARSELHCRAGAQRSRSSARPAPAKPPSSSCSTASTTSPPDASWSTASTCASGTCTELRRAIGLVQQDVFLFAGDIFDNVRLARTDLGEAEVREALGRAQALDFVERLPGGLHEEIHERGANLSAGQRQLLSFARALAYDPRILVMDEATSSVDSETESLIQLALNELLKDRTALVIAHRLSTIERADRILVLSHGVLRESGTHEELLARRGLYHRLFELQYATAAEPTRPGRGLRRLAPPAAMRAACASRSCWPRARCALAGCEVGYIAHAAYEEGLPAVAPKADRHGARAQRPAPEVRAKLETVLAVREFAARPPGAQRRRCLHQRSPRSIRERSHGS